MPASPRAERVPKRRSTGCLPCRARKKKCDGRKPSCMGCERNILLCRWSDSEAIVEPDAKASAMHTERRYSAPNLAVSHVSPSLPIQKRNSFSLPSLTHEPHFGVSLIQHPVSQMLYQHWLYETANNLSALRGPGNGFAMELPKLALRYPDTVLQSLLALSGVHYCNKNDGNPAVKELAWSHLAQALRALKYGLTKHVTGSEDQALPLLVTTLILCFVETTRGDIEGHLQHHLKASRPLLSSVLSSCSTIYQGESSTIEFIKEYYAYVSGITDLTVDFDQTSDEDDVGQLASPKNSGVLLGCSYELFDLIPQISRLSRLQNEATGDDRDHLSQVRSDLYFKILSWNPPADSDIDWVVCGSIYQQTLLMYMEATSGDQAEICEADVDQYIRTAIQFLEVLPETAPIAVTLCWPLAMIGSRTTNMEYRRTIKQRLENMYTILGIGNILATIQFLDRLWDDERSAMQSVMRTQSPSLDSMMQKYGLRMSFV